jgi:peptidoglycan hydrolase-like protein with peptidoglycan-binding domain
VSKKAVASKASSSKTTSAKAGSVAQTPAKAGTATTASHRRTSKSAKPVVVARRSYQQQPTADRLREIQQALADRGYFSGPVDGTWGAGSIDALKRFQAEQNITDDGKIGSLSLIALGLGPQRTIVADTSASNQAQLR